jgi:hypothetical protein
MNSTQSLVLVLGIILIVLSVSEYWAPQVKALVS